MIVNRTRDLNAIRSVAFHPDLIDDLLEDGQGIRDCSFDAEYDSHLEIRLDNGELIGVYLLQPKSKTVIDMHPMILPEYRNHSKESMNHVFKWILDNCSKHVHKVVAQFPSKSKHIERFAIQSGFKKEGVNRLSFMKNNRLIDQTMVGITMQEIMEALQ